MTTEERDTRTEPQMTKDDAVRLLHEIVTLVREAAERLPAEKREAKAAPTAGQRLYRQGLVDGCELTLTQIAAKCEPFVAERVA